MQDLLLADVTVDTAYQKTQRMKASKTGVKDDPLNNLFGSKVILGLHLACVGTENHQKPSNIFFLGSELIYVGITIAKKNLRTTPCYLVGKNQFWGEKFFFRNFSK